MDRQIVSQEPPGPTVVGLGEILWDLFPDGPRFGGAPANFACQASALGAEAFLVSCVGADDLGRQAIAELSNKAVNTQAVALHQELPTGQVEVRVDARGHATYQFGLQEAWDDIPWSEELQLLAQRAQAVCFGTLGQRDQRSRETICRFLAATNPQALRIFDVNLRQKYHSAELIRQSLSWANVLKMNEDELPIVAAALGQPTADAKELASGNGLLVVAVTCGARGATLSTPNEVDECPAPRVRVVDTVGAGDAFTAVLALGWLRGLTLQQINRLACNVAAFVCSKRGATPELPAKLVPF